MADEPQDQDQQKPRVDWANRLSKYFAIAAAVAAVGVLVRETPPAFVQAGHDGVAKAIISTIGGSEDQLRGTLYQAMWKNDADMAGFVLDHGLKLQGQDIYTTIANGQADVFRVFLDKGLKVKQDYLSAAVSDDYELFTTPLREQMLDSLVRHGGKIDVWVLTSAAKGGRDEELLTWILDNGRFGPSDIARAKLAAIEGGQLNAFNFLSGLEGERKADGSYNGEMLEAAVVKDPVFVTALLSSVTLSEAEKKAALAVALKNHAEASYDLVAATLSHEAVAEVVAGVVGEQDEKTQFLVKEAQQFPPRNFMPAPK